MLAVAAMKFFWCVGLLLIGLSWLLPNHYLPWTSAWGDCLAMLGTVLILLRVARVATAGTCVSWPLSATVVLGTLVVLSQWVVGKLIFGGDALVATLYIGMFFLAVLAGRMTAVLPGGSGEVLGLELVLLFAALVSVGIALVQWTGAVSLNSYAVELAPGARPGANVAQPNNFSTISFMGFCAALWLYQREKLTAWVFWLAAGFLMLGMLMSQSRTGWLQIGMLIAWGAILASRMNFRITHRQLLILGVAFVAGVSVWPTICDYLLLSAGRTLDESMKAGVRLPFWWSMLDALMREPWFGYGWLQGGLAQERVALDHPPMGALFDHSHNLFLDLLLWNGIPVGGLMVALLVWWFVVQLRNCEDVGAGILLMAVMGVFIHGMLEYPLTYAYFLVPVGFSMGVIEGALPHAKQGSIYLTRIGIMSLLVGFSILLGAVAYEYINVEERFRNMRFELARIGIDKVREPEREGRLLTQLESLMRFYRTEARPGMTAEEVSEMQRVSQRYGFPPVLLRYALATGLNGQPSVAGVTLAQLCRIHMPRRCEEGKSSWMELKQKYPQLDAVPLPVDWMKQ